MLAQSPWLLMPLMLAPGRLSRGMRSVGTASLHSCVPGLLYYCQLGTHICHPLHIILPALLL